MRGENKYCRKCGRENSRQASFCSGCGCRFAGAVPPQWAQAPGSLRAEMESGRRRRGLGKKAATSILCSILAFILLAVAAFEYPGFLVEEGEPFKLTEGEREYLPDLKAIGQIEPETAAVSNESPVVTVGEVTCDFDIWNLEGEDTLQVRSVGEVEDEYGSFRLYDFSLASGQSSFLTDVAITIPRPADEMGAVAEWFDPERGEWRPLAYEESEDGKSYILYTDHFSLMGIRKPSRTALEYLKKTDQHGANFFTISDVDPKDRKPLPALQELVVFQRADAVKLMYQERPEITTILRSNGLSAEALAENAHEETMSAIAEYMGYEDALHTTVGSRDLLLGKTVSGILGKFLWGWSTVNTLHTTMRQLEKNDEAYPVIRRNLPSIIGAVAGAVGLVAASGGTVAIAAAVIGVGSILYSPVAEYISEAPISFYEEAYFHYLNHVPTNENGHSMKMNGEGWSEAFAGVLKANQGKPERLDGEIKKLYDDYLDSFFELTQDERWIYANKNFVRGGTSGLSLYSGSYRVDYIEDEKWLEGQIYFRGHAKEILIEKTKVYLFKVMSSMIHRYEEKASEEMQNVVVPYLNQLLDFRVKDTGLKQGEYFGNTAYADNKVYPSPDVFGELNPYSYPYESQDSYRYEELPMVFEDMTPIAYFPANKQADDYSAYRFVPHGSKNSDRVFACRRYFYMMIGSPEKLLLRGDGTQDNPPVSLDFEVKDQKSSKQDIQIVEILLPRGETEEEKSDKKRITNEFVYDMDWAGMKTEEGFLEKAGESGYFTTEQDRCFALLSYALCQMTLQVDDSGAVQGSAEVPLSFTTHDKEQAQGMIRVFVEGEAKAESPMLSLKLEAEIQYQAAGSFEYSDSGVGWSYHESGSYTDSYRYTMTGTSAGDYITKNGRDVIPSEFDMTIQTYFHKVQSGARTYPNSPDREPDDLSINTEREDTLTGTFFCNWTEK